MTNWHKPPFYIGDKVEFKNQNDKQSFSSLRNSSKNVFTIKSVDLAIHTSGNFLVTLEEQSFDTPLLASRFKRYKDTLKLSEGDTIMVPLKIKKIESRPGMLILDNNVLSIAMISIDKLTKVTGKKYKVEKKPENGETWIINPKGSPLPDSEVIVLYSDSKTTYYEFKTSGNRHQTSTTYFLKHSEFKS